MKELTVFAEIENTQILGAAPTVFEPGIWRYCLYATGGILPFMDDTFNRIPIKCSNVIIDQIEYHKMDDLNQLREYKYSETTGAWYNGGSVIYVRFPSYNPPYVFFSIKHGELLGFTDGSPVVVNGKMYKSGLLSAPELTRSTDALTYDRMKFNGADVSIDNSDGQFDAAGDFFGSEFNILTAAAPERKEKRNHLIRPIEEAGGEKAVSAQSGTDEYVTLYQDEKKEEPRLTLLAQYYIENITVSLGKADFKLSDKRERLSAKIPFKQYTKEDYPDMDDNLLGKDMQEVFGHCYGVPGVCLEGKRIKASDGEPQDKYGNLTQYQFRFSSKISRVDRIQVKMTNEEIPDENGVMTKVDGWTTVYQRVKPDDGSPDDWNGQYPRWKPNIGPGEGPSYHADDAGSLQTENAELLSGGIITLDYEVAKQDGKRENRIREVRADGIFIAFDKFPDKTPRATPREIIKHIMTEYADIPYKDNYYDTIEFDNELSKLDPFEIGVMFDKPVSVYEAIEKLQSGSVLGFQFQLHRDKFTARLDDPNREEREPIPHTEILNLHEVEVDWNAGLYGAYTNIEYAHRYEEGEYSRWIDRKERQEILDIHRVDKEWNVKTLLAIEKDAKLKSDILLEDFVKMRPVIRNIKLSGEKWFGLVEGFDEPRIYDIITIDFSIPGEETDKYPRHLIRLIEEAGEEKVVSAESDTDEYITLYNDEKTARGKRDFANKISEGKLLCQILSVSPDIRAGTVTIDVRLARPSEAWKPYSS